MDKQQEQEYEALLEMFNSDGWKHFQKEFKDVLEQMVEWAPDQCPTNDDWQFRRGAIAQLRIVTGYEQFIRLSLAQEEEDASL